MMSYDPKNRPSLSEIENHPWMKKPYKHDKIRHQLIKEMDWQANQKLSVGSSDNEIINME